MRKFYSYLFSVRDVVAGPNPHVLDGSLVHSTVHGVPCTATCSLPILANWMRFMLCGAKTLNGSSQNLIQAKSATSVCSRGIFKILNGSKKSFIT